MGQAVLRIEGLPDGALDAAARFHAEWLGRARDALGSDDALVLIFSPAAYDHRAWRLAAIQGLAREVAPKRTNGVVGDDRSATDETVNWLAGAPGITGQLLEVS